jgi:hypothetical protein
MGPVKPARKAARSRRPPPPPPPEIVLAKLKERDRFGLPVHHPDVLTDFLTDGAAKREAGAKRLMAEAWEATTRVVGLGRARTLARSTCQKRAANNRKSDQARRLKVLDSYDREAAKTPGTTKGIAKRIADKLHPYEPTRAVSEARFIRQAVKKRAREQQEGAREREPIEEAGRLCPPSLLDDAANDSDQ